MSKFETIHDIDDAVERFCAAGSELIDAKDEASVFPDDFRVMEALEDAQREYDEAKVDYDAAAEIAKGLACYRLCR